MDIAFPFLIPTQDVVEGPGSSARVAEILKRNGGTKALVITDKTLHELGILDTMLKGMEEAGYPCAIYDGVEPNPSIENIEAAFAMYQ
ncbi:MAG: iron-containing alcohol dehydrogenase, partial [Acutalibacteraceae bacterium]|nr:iron-containing alcohol dehydrogenase [Acutalibacteraceae bacterium]